ncbi:hypothetical protein [Streptococcus hyointestinalis]|uniref:hypothetical protein n=1 Tax=Streptococcus hyointestinalis TaxID=1337 RepID=UPI0013E01FC7|nr:hypothetical protein [Streptococcus hyointestinalis]
MRARLKEAQVNIFDELPSSRDALSEAAFIQLIETHFTGTVILVSHCASTVPSAETVYADKAGQLLLKH